MRIHIVTSMPVVPNNACIGARYVKQLWKYNKHADRYQHITVSQQAIEIEHTLLDISGIEQIEDLEHDQLIDCNSTRQETITQSGDSCLQRDRRYEPRRLDREHGAINLIQNRLRRVAHE